MKSCDFKKRFHKSLFSAPCAAEQRPFLDDAAVGKMAVADLPAGLCSDLQRAPLLHAVGRSRVRHADRLRFLGTCTSRQDQHRRKGRDSLHVIQFCFLPMSQVHITPWEYTVRQRVKCPPVLSTIGLIPAASMVKGKERAT